MAILTAVLERIAPHEPVEDQGPEGDRRTFIERLHDADMRRAENPSTIWDNGVRRVPRIELVRSLQWTSWGLGIDATWQHGGRKGRAHGWPSRVDIMVAFGPLGWALSFEFNYSKSGM